MFFNTSVNGDPRSFMYYKGDYYIDGTEIIFSEEFVQNNKVNGKKIWPYARFDHKETNVNGSIVYYFARTRTTWIDLHDMGLDQKALMEYSPCVRVEAYNVERAIGEVTHSIKLERKETEAIQEAIINPKSNQDNPVLLVLWVVYIAVMIGSLIFQQFYIIWAIASYLFFKYRKEILKQ